MRTIVRCAICLALLLPPAAFAQTPIPPGQPILKHMPDLVITSFTVSKPQSSTTACFPGTLVYDIGHCGNVVLNATVTNQGDRDVAAGATNVTFSIQGQVQSFLIGQLNTVIPAGGSVSTSATLWLGPCDNPNCPPTVIPYTFGAEVDRNGSVLERNENNNVWPGVLKGCFHCP